MSRLLFVGMRAPAFADRRGLRWMLNERIWPAPVMVIRHRGRKSGKVYATPIEALTEDRDRREVVVGPLRGESSDWYRNVVAGGLESVSLRGETCDAEWSRLSEQQARAALDTYLTEHPRYGRMILRSLARVNGISSDPDVIAREIPTLALRLAPRPEFAVEPPGETGAPPG